MERINSNPVIGGVREDTENNETRDEITYQSSPKNLSPVFGAVKNVGCMLSPDDDIPSYQIPRESKRFSDFSEEQDSILPISPVCTPPSVKKFDNFEEPLIHTIGTIVKKNGGSKVVINEEEFSVQLKSVTKQYPNALEELGILDKDISWDSSMETPAPHPLSLEEYNTIERATLLPENYTKSIHPRALFSPHKNDDSECMPLKYSSESDDGEDYPNEIQLPDKPVISEENTTAAELKDDSTLIGSPKHCLSSNTPKTKDVESEKVVAMSPGSPVFRIKKNTKKSKTKKLRELLVKSPVTTDNDVNEMNCDTDFSESLSGKQDSDRGHNSFFSEQSNSIQDDSFQNMSFSVIDELCKGSIMSDCNTTNSTVASSIVGKENIESASNLAKGKIQSKFFYNNTEKSDELYPVPSVDSFLKCAKRLEDGGDVPGNKIKESFTDKKLTVFSKMAEDIPKCDIQGVKRIRSTEKTPRNHYKMMKLENSSEAVEEVKEPSDGFQDISSHFDANDSQMCLTAAYAESLINNQKLTDQSGNYNVNKTANKPIGSNVDNVDKISCDMKFPMFSTARGNSISVSGDAYKKVRNIFGDDYEESDAIKREDYKTDLEGEQPSGNNFQGFKTASGASIKISEKSLNKVKNLLRDVMDEKNCMEIPGTGVVGFTTASGSKIKISEESLNKARKMLDATDGEPAPESCVESPGDVGFTTASGSKIKISEESLNKARKMLDSVDVKTDTENCVNIPGTCSMGFTTASGAKIKISEESLNKARKILDTVDVKPDTENCMEVSGTSNIGFATASGSKIKISEESLIKARKMLDTLDDKPDTENSREEIRDEAHTEPRVSGFKTASNKQVEVSKEALTEVQALWRDEEEFFGDTKTVPEPIPKFCGFNTASGRNITVSEKALSNAQKLLGETEEGTSVTEEAKEPKADNAGKQTNEDENSEELIPAWLHAYNTSPTLTMERSHMEAVTSHEDCRHSTPREQYIIKSPVLGTTDRFYNRRKRNPGRKLIFEPTPKLEIPTDSTLKPNFNAPHKIGSRKRDTLEMDIDFGVPFKRRKLNDAEELTDEVKEKRRKARLQQIKAGKKGKVKPVKGSHLLKKDQPQMSWSEAVQGAVPERYPNETLLKHGVRDDVIAVTASTAADYKFKATDFFRSDDCFSNVNGFPVGDGCTLIFDDENKAGVGELTTAFFASQGVEPGLISTEWVKNHYRWIIWKFSHYERAFPVIFGGRCLTPHNVLVQLKYRYDREIDRSQRSALRRILERDDSSAKRMVLCVTDIKKVSDLESSVGEGVMGYTLGLTDGWYSCYAQTDPAMTRLIEEGKVFIGGKLVTHGAELLNCDKGVSPLEAAGSVHLKIATNSTRRAKWDVKLGFNKNGGPILAFLNAILLNGGIVGRVDVIIARIYPLLYMEKRPDGTHVTRNSRMEDRAVAAYQQQQEAAIEKIYQQVKDELRNKEKGKEKHGGKLSISEVKEVTDAEELYKLYEHCPDPSLFQTYLTSKQKEMLIDYQRRKTEINNKELSDKVQERIKAEKMNSRKVSQLLRIKIVDLHKPDYTKPVLFTVWNSMEDVSRIFSEGKAISIFNTTPGNSRFFNSVQLNSTRKTRYRELSQTVEYPARKLTNLNELTVDYEPVFNEVDIVGMVVSVHETSYGSRLSQTIFIADEGFHFAGIVFWGNCKDYGWENILTVNSIVACSNLQWSKKRSVNCIPSVYVNDTSVFTENPKQTFLKEEIKRLRIALPEDKKSFISRCAEEITAKLGESKSNSNLSRKSPIQSDSSLNSSSNVKPKYINGFKTKPNASSTPFKGAACLGLDTSEQEPSPIQKRIEKLQMYGEPPPLSPLLPLDNLEKFKSKFRVPFKNTAPIHSASK